MHTKNEIMVALLHNSCKSSLTDLATQYYLGLNIKKFGHAGHRGGHCTNIIRKILDTLSVWESTCSDVVQDILRL